MNLLQDVYFIGTPEGANYSPFSATLKFTIPGNNKHKDIQGNNSVTFDGPPLAKNYRPVLKIKLKWRYRWINNPAKDTYISAC